MAAALQTDPERAQLDAIVKRLQIIQCTWKTPIDAVDSLSSVASALDTAIIACSEKVWFIARTNATHMEVVMWPMLGSRAVTKLLTDSTDHRIGTHVYGVSTRYELLSLNAIELRHRLGSTGKPLKEHAFDVVPDVDWVEHGMRTLRENLYEYFYKKIK